MNDEGYTYNITKHRARSGRFNTGGYTADISGPNNHTFTSPRFDTEAEAKSWAAKYIEAKSAGKVQAAKTPEPTPAPVHQAPQFDRQAERVARLTGLPAAPRTGRCHYCGQPLVNGHCAECV
jgi:hypothetical protein